MDPGDADRALAIGPRLLHLTGVTPALSPSCHALVEHALAAAAEQGVPVSFDVNLRPALWPSLDEAGRVLAALANRATIVFVGGDEAARLWSCRTAEDVRAVLPAPEVLVVKDGADPVTVFGPDGSATVPALPAEVLEPVVAGVAFAGGFLHAWLDGRPADEAARLGHLIAGVALRSAGDVVVDLDPDLPDLARGPWPPPTLLEPR
jgi:2-dehydro-3-deoxygluconokinase